MILRSLKVLGKTLLVGFDLLILGYCYLYILSIGIPIAKASGVFGSTTMMFIVLAVGTAMIAVHIFRICKG